MDYDDTCSCGCGDIFTCSHVPYHDVGCDLYETCSGWAGYPCGGCDECLARMDAYYRD